MVKAKEQTQVKKTRKTKEIIETSVERTTIKPKLLKKIIKKEKTKNPKKDN